MSVINDCIIIKGVIVAIKYISDKYKIYHNFSLSEIISL